MATQTSLPRMYHIGLESFLRHNPDTTLYLYGNLNAIDPGFASNGFRVVLVSLNLTAIQQELVDVVPDLDQAVFQTDIWTTQILPSIRESPMILSDFVRLSLLFLHGGSWLDADAIYLRPFTMRNGLPCHEKVTIGRGYFWLQCNDNQSVRVPFDDSLPIVPGQTFYCTNGIMGQFERHHPFLRKALLSMVATYPDLDFNPGLKTVALGGHLFVSTMLSTASAPKRPDAGLLATEWPLLYNISQMFGFWALNDFAQLHSNNVSARSTTSAPSRALEEKLCVHVR